MDDDVVINEAWLFHGCFRLAAYVWFAKITLLKFCTSTMGDKFVRSIS